MKSLSHRIYEGMFISESVIKLDDRDSSIKKNIKIIMDEVLVWESNERPRPSRYFEFKDKVIRVSDHRPNMINFRRNVEANDVFLLFVRQEHESNPITMDNIDDTLDAIEQKGYYVDGIVVDNKNFDFVQFSLDRFFNY